MADQAHLARPEEDRAIAEVVEIENPLLRHVQPCLHVLVFLFQFSRVREEPGVALQAPKDCSEVPVVGMMVARDGEGGGVGGFEEAPASLIANVCPLDLYLLRCDWLHVIIAANEEGRTTEAFRMVLVVILWCSNTFGVGHLTPGNAQDVPVGV